MEEIKVSDFISSLATPVYSLSEANIHSRSARVQAQLGEIISRALGQLGELLGESILLEGIFYPNNHFLDEESCFVNAEAFGVEFTIELSLELARRLSSLIKLTIPPRWQEEELVDELQAVDFAASWIVSTNPKAANQSIKVLGVEKNRRTECSALVVGESFAKARTVDGRKTEGQLVGCKFNWGAKNYTLYCFLAAPLIRRISLYAERRPLNWGSWRHLSFLCEFTLRGTVEEIDRENQELGIDVVARELTVLTRKKALR